LLVILSAASIACHSERSEEPPHLSLSCFCFSSFVAAVLQNALPKKLRHSDRSHSQSHREWRSGGTPAFRSCFCCCFCFYLSSFAEGGGPAFHSCHSPIQTQPKKLHPHQRILLYRSVGTNPTRLYPLIDDNERLLLRETRRAPLLESPLPTVSTWMARTIALSTRSPRSPLEQ